MQCHFKILSLSCQLEKFSEMFSGNDFCEELYLVLANKLYIYWLINITRVRNIKLSKTSKFNPVWVCSHINQLCYLKTLGLITISRKYTDAKMQKKQKQRFLASVLLMLAKLMSFTIRSKGTVLPIFWLMNIMTNLMLSGRSSFFHPRYYEIGSVRLSFHVSVCL